ncbi:MAG: SGNH/GDSL hydrolase family protein, partial [Chloroflexota bacterium]|nr:SGNH/GDSL hydrolase family protein [Chloroflexota bacterium]
LVHVRSGPTVLLSALYRRRARTGTSTHAHAAGGPRRGLGDEDSLHPGWIHQGNLALGILLGRHRRVSAGQVGEAVAATEAAARVAVVPVVMGPTGVLRGPADQLVCRTLNRALRRASEVHGFAFVDVLDGWDRSFSLPDGTHLTVEGHRHVADRLVATIGPQVAAHDWGGDRAPGFDGIGLAQGVLDASLR